MRVCNQVVCETVPRVRLRCCPSSRTSTCRYSWLLLGRRLRAASQMHSFILAGKCYFHHRYKRCGLDRSRSLALFRRSDILLHFPMRAAQSWIMLKTTSNFAIFNSLWNLGKGWIRLLTNYWSFTYDRTSEIHLMAIHCVTAERGGFIKKKKVHG